MSLLPQLVRILPHRLKLAPRPLRTPRRHRASRKLHDHRQTYQTPDALALGWPLPVWVDKEIPWRSCSKTVPAPVESNLKGIIMGECLINKSSGAEFLKPTADRNEDVEEAPI